jgi:hypothetical protein
MPTAFGSRRDVIRSERVDRISPAALLTAEVTSCYIADQRGTEAMIMAEASACRSPALRAVAPASGQRPASDARSSYSHPSSSTGSGWYA